MYTLDANVFVRDLDPRDPEYEACHRLIQRLRDAQTSIILPFITLAEVAGAAGRMYRDPLRGRLVSDALSDLPNIVFVPIDEPLARASAEIAADYALRGMDAIYVAVARQHGCTFVTLDEEPRQRASAVIQVQTPAESLVALTSSEA